MKKTLDERILSLLQRRRSGITLRNITRELGVSPKENPRLKRKLKSLEGTGVIQRNRSRYFIPKKTEIIRGVFLASSRGFGFVSSDENQEDDIFIPARCTEGAVQGDIVEILCKERGKKGKPEGRILRIIKRGREKIVGLYRESYGQPYFIPFDTPFSEEIPISSKNKYSPLPGMVVEIDRKTKTITEVFGKPDDPGVDEKVIIQRYNLSPSFSEESLKEAANISAEIPEKEKTKRVDYRAIKTVTIDGKNAQDFDDAVSIKKLKNGRYLLGVHIADVSHYVRPESSIDREAFKRGTSVYFPSRTLPMLPQKLSNHICSLRPKVERLAFSVLMEIEKNGEVLKSEFHPSLIQTAERMTYDSVYKIFKGDKHERNKYRFFVPDLLLMRELAGILRARREAEGSLDFDLTEPELVYREGELYSVESFGQNEAHHLIEEFMLAANEAVASYLNREEVPIIYRIHPRPSISSLSKLREMLAHFNLSLPDSKKIKAGDLQKVINIFKDKPEEKFIVIQILRSLKLAVYSDQNQGHYALAKKDYTHFTSPIRRYPDLVVHRILKKALGGEKYQIPSISSIASICSQRERDAESAEKRLVEWRILRFLHEKLGDEFEGMIVGISRAGLIVELDNYFVDGLIPYKDLSGDFFFKKSDKTLVGKRTGRKFELGDRVKVILAAVDPFRGRMDFALSAKN